MSMPQQLRVFRHFFKLARRDITVRKGRAILTIVGIMIGIATLVSLMSIGLGMRQQIGEQLDELLGMGLILQGEGLVGVPEPIVDQVKSVPHVVDAYPMIMVMGQLKSDSCMLLGIPPGKMESYLTGLKLLEGRELTVEDQGKVVVQDTFADKLDIDFGDVITIELTMGGRKTFEVVGIFQLGMSITPVQIGIVAGNLKGFQRTINREGYVSSVIVRVDDRNQVNNIDAQLRSMFPGARITKEEEILEQVNSIMDIINAVLLAMTSISLLIAGLSVMNTIMMVVRERTREIGILKSIGAKRWHILAIFLSEAALLSVAGGIAGCVLGVIGTYAITEAVHRLVPITLLVVVSPDVLASGLVVSTIIGLLSGLQPSWRGASIRPIEAIRYE